MVHHFSTDADLERLMVQPNIALLFIRGRFIGYAFVVIFHHVTKCDVRNKGAVKWVGYCIQGLEEVW